MATFAEAVAGPSDPFQDPVLGALRERKFAGSSGLGVEKGERIYLHGDWETLGRSNHGAGKLLSAVVKCFMAEGIVPSNPWIAPRELSDRLAESVPNKNGRAECIIAMDFDKALYPPETVNAVLRKIIHASREIEAASSLGPAN